MKNQNAIIRKGTVEDVPAAFSLIKELALYEKAPEQVTITLDELIEDGFGQNPIYGLFVAEFDSEVIGIALYYEKYSTWQGRCIYLEDIVVTESHRAKGIGHQLFQAVIGVAKKRNSARMEWISTSWFLGSPSTSVISPNGEEARSGQSVSWAMHFCPCRAPFILSSGM